LIFIPKIIFFVIIHSEKLFFFKENNWLIFLIC
jgi:hypothetical protein